MTSETHPSDKGTRSLCLFASNLLHYIVIFDGQIRGRVPDDTSKRDLVHWHPVLDPLGLLDVYVAEADFLPHLARIIIAIADRDHLLIWQLQFKLRLVTRSFVVAVDVGEMSRVLPFPLVGSFPRRICIREGIPVLAARSKRASLRVQVATTLLAQEPSPDDRCRGAGTIPNSRRMRPRPRAQEYPRIRGRCVHVRLMVATHVATAPAPGGGAELTCTGWPSLLGPSLPVSVFYDECQLPKDDPTPPSRHEESPPQPTIGGVQSSGHVTQNSNDWVEKSSDRTMKRELRWMAGVQERRMYLGSGKLH
ncbi:hypothetical protein B0H17DRAFT_1126639 [Mycena rosella]|uniref:Uncharacterized protein n=1 Tax=Mycena rosella TaxID=1033263 RepID=A0AAD7GTL9_MYCRO|nr:hypothetical protein B0H17DRAFT_1126639 [Mycena rosella]